LSPAATQRLAAVSTSDAVEAHQTGSSRGDELAENDLGPGELLGGRPDES
jgi:hypothetical protein